MQRWVSCWARNLGRPRVAPETIRFWESQDWIANSSRHLILIPRAPNDLEESQLHPVLLAGYPIRLKQEGHVRR